MPLIEGIGEGASGNRPLEIMDNGEKEDQE